MSGILPGKAPPRRLSTPTCECFMTAVQAVALHFVCAREMNGGKGAPNKSCQSAVCLGVAQNRRHCQTPCATWLALGHGTLRLAFLSLESDRSTLARQSLRSHVGSLACRSTSTNRSGLVRRRRHRCATTAATTTTTATTMATTKVSRSHFTTCLTSLKGQDVDGFWSQNGGSDPTRFIVFGEFRA